MRLKPITIKIVNNQQTKVNNPPGAALPQPRRPHLQSSIKKTQTKRKVVTQFDSNRKFKKKSNVR